jgi:hypothetical protein
MGRNGRQEGWGSLRAGRDWRVRWRGVSALGWCGSSHTRVLRFLGDQFFNSVGKVGPGGVPVSGPSLGPAGGPLGQRAIFLVQN